MKRRAIWIVAIVILLGVAGYALIATQRPNRQPVDPQEAQNRLDHERAMKSLKETQDEVEKLKAHGAR